MTPSYGERREPSNSTEGADFDDCDDNELCEIIAAEYRGQAVEWRELPSGETICTAFVAHEKPLGETQRCAHTVDMFTTEGMP